MGDCWAVRIVYAAYNNTPKDTNPDICSVVGGESRAGTCGNAERGKAAFGGRRPGMVRKEVGMRQEEAGVTPDEAGMRPDEAGWSRAKWEGARRSRKGAAGCGMDKK